MSIGAVGGAAGLPARLAGATAHRWRQRLQALECLPAVSAYGLPPSPGLARDPPLELCLLGRIQVFTQHLSIAAEVDKRVSSVAELLHLLEAEQSACEGVPAEKAAACQSALKASGKQLSAQAPSCEVARGQADKLA